MLFSLLALYFFQVTIKLFDDVLQVVQGVITSCAVATVKTKTSIVNIVLFDNVFQVVQGVITSCAVTTVKTKTSIVNIAG